MPSSRCQDSSRRAVDPGRHAFLLHTRDYREFCRRVARAVHRSEFSTTLRTSVGRVFVKGITTENPGVRAHRHEAAINPRLSGLAPRLLWTVEKAGWLLLGYEYVDGRHTDLSPGSPDLPLLAEALHDLAGRPAGDAPDLAAHWARLAAWRRLRHDPPADLHPWSRANLDPFVEWERHAMFAVAVLGIWEFLQRDQPLPHRERLTDAARRWARHRLG